MINEHCGNSQRFVTLENGWWRFGELAGSVAASVPLRRHRQFCEVAVLTRNGGHAPCYAARLVGTDHWLHFNRLHSWMYPIVEELLGVQESYQQIAELVAKTQRLTQ